MKLLFKRKVLNNRASKNVRPNRNENGFMSFVNDYVKYTEFDREF